MASGSASAAASVRRAREVCRPSPATPRRRRCTDTTTATPASSSAVSHSAVGQHRRADMHRSVEMSPCSAMTNRASRWARPPAPPRARWQCQPAQRRANGERPARGAPGGIAARQAGAPGLHGDGRGVTMGVLPRSRSQLSKPVLVDEFAGGLAVLRDLRPAKGCPA